MVSETKFVHILGAGLNSEKPANSAVKDLSERGWNPIPIHPKDAGASISGYPIRPMIEDGIGPEIVVLFLAPERAREAVKSGIPAIVNIWVDKEEFAPGTKNQTMYK